MKKNNQNIEHLLTLYLTGECSPDQRRQVEQWLEEHYEIQQQYEALKNTYELTLNDPIPKIDPEAAKARFKRKMEDQSFPTTASNKSSFVRITAIAASVLLLIGSSWYFLFFINNAQPEMITVITDDLLLPDGSHLYAPKPTTFRYAKNFPVNRQIQMPGGKVFFDVAKDPSHPFTVCSGFDTLTVLGTSFETEYLTAKTYATVRLITGKLRVVSPGDTSFLTPGNEIEIFNKTHIHRPIRDNNHLAWHTKELVFENTRLDSAILELNRVLPDSARPVELNNKTSKCTISGTFKADNYIKLIQQWALLTGSELSNERNKLRLLNEGC